MSNYPNLEALGQGCVSGSICEWPMLKVEARKAIAEIKAMRKRIKCLEDACREFVRFAELPNTVDRGDYIRYQIKAIGAAKEALSRAGGK